MSLTGRFATLFLGMLAVVLVGFSVALYLAVRFHLERQIQDRLAAALAVLTAAAEVHPEGVEWEPSERVLPIGDAAGPGRLQWMVFDERGRRIDRSRNLDDSVLTPDWTPHADTAILPARLRDREGNRWQVAQSMLYPERRDRPADAPNASAPIPAEHFHPAITVTACAPIGPTETTLAALIAFLTTLSLGIWLVAGFLCNRLARRSLAPLARLVASARALDATDPGWCLEAAGTGDELDELGRAFNDLLARLHLAYDRQRRFSGDASHQLRTPLTVMIGQLEVALRHDRSDEEYRRVLRTVLGKADQLRDIVEALLYLLRADPDTDAPKGDVLDLNDWVDSYLASRPADPRVANIVYERSGVDRLLVRVHGPLLAQLLDNLLDNARKYSAPGMPITVRTGFEADEAVLEVVDSGPGITLEDLPHIFKPFYRSASAPRSPGSGLGLSLVERIAVAFGGRVLVRSEHGNGCHFEVRLPRREAAHDENGMASAP